jgi:hypothetical protein
MTQGTTSAVSALAGSRRESELIDQISKLPDLTQEQKAALMGRVLGGGGGASTADTSAGTGTGAATPTVEPPAPTPVDPAAQTIPPTPLPKPAKPSLPRPEPPGKLVVVVAVDMLAEVPTRDVQGTLTVSPAGADPAIVGPMTLEGGSLQAVFDNVQFRSGSLHVELSWDAVFYDPPAPGGGRRRPLVAGGTVRIDNSITFTAPPGRNVVLVDARPNVRPPIQVKASSAVVAVSKSSNQLQGGVVFKVDLGKFGAQLGGGDTSTSGGETTTTNTQEDTYLVYVVERQLALTLQPFT